jgi:hypothetical protein
MNAHLANSCREQDFEEDGDFYACSDAITADLSGSHFRARAWLANNFVGSNPITVQLRRGSCGNEGTLVAEASNTITNDRPAQEHIFDFGTIPSLNLSNESLVVKLIYSGAEFDGHMYWNCGDTPSALRIEPVVPMSRWGTTIALPLLAALSMYLIRRRLRASARS